MCKTEYVKAERDQTATSDRWCLLIEVGPEVFQDQKRSQAEAAEEHAAKGKEIARALLRNLPAETSISMIREMFKLVEVNFTKGAPL